jgi:uncharacterized membrane protein YtjA (UPF0391 family)
MLQVALGVLIMALVAGILGFGGILSAAVGAAEILFAVFIMLFFVSILLDRQRG